MRPDDAPRLPAWPLRAVHGLAHLAIHHPRKSLAVAVLVSLLAGLYASAHMRINSDYRQLISRDVPFRKAYEDHLDAFPQFRDLTLVVLDGESVATLEDAQADLAEALRARTDVVSSVYAPGAESWYEDHAFLYLDVDELERVAARLAEAQPALAALAVDPSLRGLLDELGSAVERLAEDGEVPAGFALLADKVAAVARSLNEGNPRAISWSDEIFDSSGRSYRLVIIQGRQQFEETVPAAKLIETVRAEAARLELVPERGVRVRLTGLVPLNHDELLTIRKGIFRSVALTAVLLVVILGFGLRSLPVIGATLVALGLSFVVTTAWAMWSVGEYNTISAAFSVLIMGLGVDFGIHIGLRQEEALARGLPVREALDDAVAHTLMPITLCMLTSVIGFASFVPTQFRGLAELGVIASGGLLLTYLASYSALLSILAIAKPAARRIEKSNGLVGPLRTVIERRARPILAVTTALAAAAVYLTATGAVFDFDTLSLKDPSSESLVVLDELQRERIVTDYTVTVAAPSREEAEAMAARLAADPLVAEVQPPSHHVPADQPSKLFVLEQTSYLLESALYPGPQRPTPSDAERLDAIRALVAQVRSVPADADPGARASAEGLARALEPLLAAPDPGARARELEASVVADIPRRLAWLKRAIEVGPVAFDDLPAEARARIVAEDGQALVVVFPSEDVSNVVALGRFVDAVRAVTPSATGRPVVEAGLGGMVVDSLRTAMAITFVAILALLWLVLRSLRDSLLVIVPIVLAALFTVAFGVLADVPFNMVNVVAVPLILGLGVDSGIHVFMRTRENRSLASAVESTTPRAVTLSALTTLAAFGALSISSHRGMASLGVLLSVAILAILGCSLVVLPAMLELRDRRARRAPAA